MRAICGRSNSACPGLEVDAAPQLDVLQKASGGERGWQRLGGKFGRAQLPVPGQKLIKVLDGVIGDSSEHVGFLR
jgi:hypothetical protein